VEKGSAPVKAMVRIAVGDVNGDGVFDTEMLALDISGGSLPAGVMIRESPTLASTGRTTMAFVGSANGGVWKTSSFFDVFTELSIDGGQTWEAATAPESIALDPGLRRDFHPSNFQPLDAALRKVDDDTIDFVGNAAIGRYVLRAGIPLNRGAAATRRTDATDHDRPGHVLRSLARWRADFHARQRTGGVRVAVGDLNGDGVYETEMLQMDVTGGTLPAGVMIRESPRALRWQDDH
jgi:hypothetical protein